MREKGGWVSGFILFSICILIWSGGSGNHPNKNIIFVARLKSEKYKYPKPYPSIYVWAGGWSGRSVCLGGLGWAGFCPPLATTTNFPKAPKPTSISITPRFWFLSQGSSKFSLLYKNMGKVITCLLMPPPPTSTAHQLIINGGCQLKGLCISLCHDSLSLSLSLSWAPSLSMQLSLFLFYVIFFFSKTTIAKPHISSQIHLRSKTHFFWIGVQSSDYGMWVLEPWCWACGAHRSGVGGSCVLCVFYVQI